MSNAEKLEVLAKEIYPNAKIRYGRSQVHTQYGYTLYPCITDWKKDARFLGKSFIEALDELERIGIDMITVRCACSHQEGLM